MRYALISILLFAASSLSAQPAGNVFVDKEGVMRWEKSREEVKGFGINYTAMFAHAYRTAQQRNVPIEKAIEEDIYHFSRLGFDLFRVHVWDTEISDSLGNLLANEHLRLFDFAIARMKERGFRFILTPIAFWGNGWPEPDEKTPGFATKYGKDACLTNPDAIRAQQNYLKQFLNHVNTYTGMPYKSDPAVLAFEVSNEPHHREPGEKVTTFIKGMIDAMRSTGCKKPIFYNVSHSIHLAEAYAKAGIQGGTFQWYPTGLGAAHELGGNLLPNVDRYAIPFAAAPSWKRLAKVVYEFDAADVGRSYIYPAMARSFRQAGIQTATHFAYDPTFMADVNTEYGTHYMNLAYAPQKALSLKIAGEVFRRVPRYKSYGPYPGNERFDVFRVSYEEDLAEMVTESNFYYTNHTESVPPAAGKLEHIAGWGDSPVVRYEGTGAYFLDQLSPSIWRLEVMPDAVWIDDPFKPSSPKRKVAVIQWNEWPMSITLPDLGNVFEVHGINEGNNHTGSATDGSLVIGPGAYVLTRSGLTSQRKAADKWSTIRLGEFAAPAPTVDRTYLLHRPPDAMAEGNSVTLNATVIGLAQPTSVEVHLEGGRRSGTVIPMVRTRNFQYTATLPGSTGYVRYYLVVRNGKDARTFPADVAGEPRDWDFIGRQPYELPVLPANEPVVLFDAERDNGRLSRNWVPGSGLIPTAYGADLNLQIPRLFVPDPENPDGPRIDDYSMRCYFGDRIAGLKSTMAGKRELVLSVRVTDSACPVQVALVDRNGQAWGVIIQVEPGRTEYRLPLTALKPVKLVTLPRPYPTFLPYFFEGGSAAAACDLLSTETVQFSLGPGMNEIQRQKPVGIVIRSLTLE